MISPTFQSNNVISLKEDLFKQNRGYVEVNLDLKEWKRRNEDKPQLKLNNQKKGDDQAKR